VEDYQLALVRAPFGTSQIKGSLGSTTFQQTRAGLIARGRTVPVNPNSPQQAVIRAQMANNSGRWTNTLTALQRADWEAYAQETPLPNRFGDLVNKGGRQMYLRQNNARTYVGLAPIDDAPLTPGVADTPIVIITGDTTNGIEAQSVTPTLGASDFVIVRIGNAVNQSKNYYSAPFSLVTFLSSAAVFPLLLKPPAQVAIGQRYFMAFRLFLGNGKVGDLVSFPLDITA
jgi:hypothetical protein